MKRLLRYVKRQLIRCCLWIQYFFSNEICNEDPIEARKVLQEFCPKPTSSAIIEYREFGNDYDLAIIIPAYNAEKWLRECLDSIIHQKTTYSLQILVVNDGSSDHTGDILSDYKNDSRITIITQENKGYSGARNVAIRKVKSTYLMFVDSDDFILPDSIQILMDTATWQNADIVEGNGYTFNENGRIGKVKPINEQLWGGPCLKVMRSSLFSRVEFPEEYLYEDTIIGSLIMPQANKIIFIDDEVYAYRIHSASITQKKDNNPKRVHSYWIMELMEKDAEKIGISKKKNFDDLSGHIVITQRRCCDLPEDMQKHIFVLTREVLNDFKSSNNCKLKMLLKAFKSNQYGKYQLLCRLW